MEFRQGADDPCRYNQSVINFEENMEMGGGESRVNQSGHAMVPALPWLRRGPPRQSTSVIPPGPPERRRPRQAEDGPLTPLGRSATLHSWQGRASLVQK